MYYNPMDLPLHRAFGYENPGYPQSPMETGVLADMLRGLVLCLFRLFSLIILLGFTRF